MSSLKRALITGVTGQDGSYLAELLLRKDYEVHGLTRNCDGEPAARLRAYVAHAGLDERPLHLHAVEPAPAGLSALIRDLEPDEIYNLAAQSHVGRSFESPVETVQANAVGPAAILEAARELGRPVRICQASSSAMFGAAAVCPQTEATPFHPRSPYACAKVCAFHLVANYREAYGVFACNGILFNHESPRRSPEYVTRKITRAAARISLGLEHTLTLGNLQVERDWGYAPEFVEAMWRMLQHDVPDDYVIATNRRHSLEQFLQAAFDAVGLNWREHVQSDPRLFRPAEVALLQGDFSKAQQTLGWRPQTDFAELVALMVEADLVEARGVSSSQQ